jgi:hypothetical protein
VFDGDLGVGPGLSVQHQFSFLIQQAHGLHKGKKGPLQ